MPPGEASGSDKRKAERVAANFAVSFREIEEEEAEALNEVKSLGVRPAIPPPVSAASPAAHSENISEGGISFTGDLQLLGDKKLAKGRKLLVEFSLPGQAAPVSAVAVVAWSIEGTGSKGKFTAGLMFTGIEPEDLDKIQRYVESKGK